MLHRSSFDYKFEEPLNNLDTEPRFFKKTLETLSGFLTHTFSTEDAKDNTRPKLQSQKKPLLRNPLENIKPIKFPHAAIHNYQEVPHITYSKEVPHPSQTNSKEVVKPLQPITSRPSNQHKAATSSLLSNSWKPSQRL